MLILKLTERKKEEREKKEREEDWINSIEIVPALYKQHSENRTNAMQIRSKRINLINIQRN